MAEPGACRFDVELGGCRPEPLASYLKALAILRLVVEQEDPEARGSWAGETFVLRSAFDRDALLAFFLERWHPTPVVAPWNGGSGFWPSTSDDALRAIEGSVDPRLGAYAEAIAGARAAILALELKDAPEKGPRKTALITLLRSRLSDRALEWVDAAAVLTDGDPVYPALLGTGGNDGRQDFTNNFMQRVLAALDEPSGLAPSLFGTCQRVGGKGSMGQFLPTSLSRSNAWDFVFAVEGALVLAGAATRRLESRGGASLAFPFHVRSSSAPSLADGEEGHGEIWLPKWEEPATYREVKKLFSEGRAKSPQGTAAVGLDFARSVACLGTDRGLTEFTRFSFQPRNGKNYFATPLGRFSTREVPSARLLDDIDGWYERFRQKASGKNVPAGVAMARQRLELAMFEAAQRGTLGPVLLGLGEAERALAQSLSFTTKAFLHPVRLLQPAWAEAASDGTVEQRLAGALAARPGMRERITPLDKFGRSFGRGDDSAVTFAARPLIDNLHALLLREDVEAQQKGGSAADEPRSSRCSLGDLAAFIAGRVDDALIERWLRALVLVDGWEDSAPREGSMLPPAAYATLALVHHRHVGDDTLPRTAGLLARACAGDAVGATAMAIRRLTAAGRPLPVSSLLASVSQSRRAAAALAFPLTQRQRRRLESMVLPAPDDDAPGVPVRPSQEIA